MSRRGVFTARPAAGSQSFSQGRHRRAWGHDVHLAADSPSALESSQRVRPPVVVLDTNLPGMSGWEVARQLRQHSNGTLWLIALTGYDGDEERARSLDAGFNAHLTKPADLRKIRGLLTAAAEEVPGQIAAQDGGGGRADAVGPEAVQAGPARR